MLPNTYILIRLYIDKFVVVYVFYQLTFITVIITVVVVLFQVKWLELVFSFCIPDITSSNYMLHNLHICRYAYILTKRIWATPIIFLNIMYKLYIYESSNGAKANQQILHTLSGFFFLFNKYVKKLK